MITIPKELTSDDFRELGVQVGDYVLDETVVGQDEILKQIRIVDLEDYEKAKGFEYICGGALHTLNQGILLIEY